MRNKSLAIAIAIAAMAGALEKDKVEGKIVGFDELREPTRKQEKLAAAQSKRDRKNALRLLKKQRGEGA